MKHQVDGRKFGRNTSHRKAMFKNMANSVIMAEQIVTTVQKAKETRRVVDRLITLGKSGSLASRRLAFGRTRDDEVVAKLFGELAKRYEKRDGGYTRVLKMAERRWGDAAEMAIIELVDHPVIDRKRKVKAAKPAAEGADKKDAAPADPFARFRKMFGNAKSNVSGGGAPKRAKGAKSTARKVAPGGGGGKSGGGSSA